MRFYLGRKLRCSPGGELGSDEKMTRFRVAFKDPRLARDNDTRSCPKGCKREVVEFVW